VPANAGATLVNFGALSPGITRDDRIAHLAPEVEPAR
jgi:hypothetical protein